MSYSGKFKPKNYKKYRGDPTKIFYRSLWERRFMVYCDNNDKIIEWGSEETIIPYRSPLDRKVHRYFPDFYIKYINKDKQVVREIIEVKPKKQLKPPKEPKRRTQRYLNEVTTYMVNQAKFKAAQEYCDDRKLGFRILTEDHLVPKKKK
jgi:hypothetical protein|tara:strand:- start:6044 stop:6490 length:447 start_codon:yes stop_codon:yes gene_type:complete